MFWLQYVQNARNCSIWALVPQRGEFPTRKGGSLQVMHDVLEKIKSGLSIILLIIVAVQLELLLSSCKYEQWEVVLPADAITQ
ncbi:unnamed protein product [Amoebophrya sp. A120]|nr:unnamed protein product [Amoebophrya sp. A120]|eukprot:GSA120T00022306001.1